MKLNQCYICVAYCHLSTLFFQALFKVHKTFFLLFLIFVCRAFSSIFPNDSFHYKKNIEKVNLIEQVKGKLCSNLNRTKEPQIELLVHSCDL